MKTRRQCLYEYVQNDSGQLVCSLKREAIQGMMMNGRVEQVLDWRKSVVDGELMLMVPGG